MLVSPALTIPATLGAVNPSIHVKLPRRLPGLMQSIPPLIYILGTRLLAREQSDTPQYKMQ